MVKRPKGPLRHNVCINFVGYRTFLPANIRQALPRGRGVGGGGGDVLMQANEQTEIGPGNKSLKKMVAGQQPSCWHESRGTHMNLFFLFFATFYL